MLNKSIKREEVKTFEENLADIQSTENSIYGRSERKFPREMFIESTNRLTNKVQEITEAELEFTDHSTKEVPVKELTRGIITILYNSERFIDCTEGVELGVPNEYVTQLEQTQTDVRIHNNITHRMYLDEPETPERYNVLVDYFSRALTKIDYHVSIKQSGVYLEFKDPKLELVKLYITPYSIYGMRDDELDGKIYYLGDHTGEINLEEFNETEEIEREIEKLSKNVKAYIEREYGMDLDEDEPTEEK